MNLESTSQPGVCTASQELCPACKTLRRTPPQANKQIAPCCLIDRLAPFHRPGRSCQCFGRWPIDRPSLLGFVLARTACAPADLCTQLSISMSSSKHCFLQQCTGKVGEMLVGGSGVEVRFFCRKSKGILSALDQGVRAEKGLVRGIVAGVLSGRCRIEGPPPGFSGAQIDGGSGHTAAV